MASSHLTTYKPTHVIANGLKSNINNNLIVLMVGYLSNKSQFEQLSKCKDLEYININHSYKNIDSLEPLRGCIKLRYIDFKFNNKIDSLNPLHKCKGIEYIDFGNNERIKSLEPLRGNKNIKYIDFHDSEKIDSLEPLRGNKSIEYIDFYNNEKIDPSDVLNECKELKCAYFNKNIVKIGN